MQLPALSSKLCESSCVQQQWYGAKPSKNKEAESVTYHERFEDFTIRSLFVSKATKTIATFLAYSHVDLNVGESVLVKKTMHHPSDSATSLPTRKSWASLRVGCKQGLTQSSKVWTRSTNVPKPPASHVHRDR